MSCELALAAFAAETESHLVTEPHSARFRRYAEVTARLLAHPDPVALPVDHAMRIQLWVNTATAKALGIPVPQSVLSRADRVIG